jgi:hypothetical protein
MQPTNKKGETMSKTKKQSFDVQFLFEHGHHWITIEAESAEQALWRAEDIVAQDSARYETIRNEASCDDIGKIEAIEVKGNGASIYQTLAEAWDLTAFPEPVQHCEGGYQYPETEIAAYAPTARHPEGRQARSFDIVRGTSANVGSYGELLFIGQVVRVLPLAGKAEVALIERPAALAARFPHMALQNVTARMIERVLVRLDQLELQSRASRPVAPYLKAALGRPERRLA